MNANDDAFESAPEDRRSPKGDKAGNADGVSVGKRVAAGAPGEYVAPAPLGMGKGKKLTGVPLGP